MKDLNIPSGIYNFSILDDDEVLEKNSDIGVHRIQINNIDEIYAWAQALFDKLQESVHKNNVENFTTILYIHLNNIYKLRANKYYNSDNYRHNYRHVLYMNDIINNIIASDFDLKIFTDETNYDYMKLNNEDHSIHHVVSNIVFFILGNIQVFETMDNIFIGKYRNSNAYNTFLNIIQYHIENFDKIYFK
jgi:hypothetical protein